MKTNYWKWFFNIRYNSFNYIIYNKHAEHWGESFTYTTLEIFKIQTEKIKPTKDKNIYLQKKAIKKQKSKLFLMEQKYKQSI